MFLHPYIKQGFDTGDFHIIEHVCISYCMCVFHTASLYFQKMVSKLSLIAEMLSQIIQVYSNLTLKSV